MGTTSLILHLTVAVGVLVGVPVIWHAMRHDRKPGPVGSSSPSGPSRWYHRPGWWLALVIGMLFCNQLLFTVYALRIRHGDLSDMSRLVPSGWFELADNQVMVSFAAHVPAPGILSVTMLRIPSLLELPFGMLAYLTVVNWLDPGRYRALATPAVLCLASASYTITFSLIEWALPTPYTDQDLALRAISGVLCAFCLIWLGRQPSAPPGVGAPRGPGELLAFVVSTAALGYLVLAIYDTAALYSLGRCDDYLPGATVAAAALMISRRLATRWRGRPDPVEGPFGGAGLDTLSTGLSWWLALFLIPALAIRYELGFGSWKIAAGSGMLIIAVAMAAALREVAARLASAHQRLPARIWLRQLFGAGVLGLAAAAVGLGYPTAYPEARLLGGATLFALVTTVTCACSDRLRSRRALST